MATTTRGSSGVDVTDGIIVGGSVWVVGFILAFVAGLVLSPLIGGSLFFTLAIYINSADIVSFLMSSSASGSYIVFVLIPLFGALIGGYILGSKSNGDGAMAGASVAVGFFALHLLGLAVLMLMVSNAFGAGAMSGITLDTIIALLIGGLAQPAVVGAIGGTLGGS